MALPESATQFIEDSAEHLALIEQELVKLDEQCRAGESIAATGEIVMRELHSLKGGAGMLGLKGIERLCHCMESIVGGAVAAGQPVDAMVMNFLLEAVDDLSGARELICRSGELVDDGGLQAVIDRLELFAPPPAPEAPPSPPAAAAAPVAPAAAPDPADEMIRECEKLWDMSEHADILDEYCEEVEEILGMLDQNVVQLETNPEDREVIDLIFRGMHTVKGNSGMINFGRMKIVAHHLENIFDNIRQQKQFVTQPLVDLLLAGLDLMRKLLDRVKSRHPVEEIDIRDIMHRIARLTADEAAVGGRAPAAVPAVSPAPAASLEHSPAAASAPAAPIARPPAAAASRPAVDKAKPAAVAAAQTLRVAIEKLDKAMNLVGELVINKGRFDQQLRDMGNMLPELETAAGRLSGRIEQVVANERLQLLQYQVESALRVQADAAGVDTWLPPVLAVLREHLDAFAVTTQKMVAGDDEHAIMTVVQDMERMSKVLREFIQELEQSTDYIGYITGELQQAMMRTRMVPVAQLFNKYPRVVRDLSQTLGKQIALEIRGEETELDKAMVDDVADPLMHIIRNSLDHGIETPERRAAAGKAPEGRLLIAAYYEGSHAVIEITDDGAGIDPQKIKASAIKKGILNETIAANMTDEEALNLIFAPGFSTAEKISEVSGRGVGMDVVKSNIDKLKGTVELQSQVGKGTTLKIQLPLTLAIIQVLLVSSRSQTFALPIAVVEETLSLALSEIRMVGNKEVFNLRGEVLPVVSLDAVLGLEGERREDAGSVPVAVVYAGQKRLGLIVDRLLGKREIVIKSLGNLLKKVPYVSGSTIMGDGSVILIIDIPAVIRNINALEMGGRAVAARPAAAPGAATTTAVARNRSLLVVDDSATIRKRIKEMLVGEGFDVTEAEDGPAALALAAQRTFDLVSVDVMMPRMSGYEVVKELRQIAAFKETPVIIVSAKGEKLDKKRGFDSGADEYLLKPFDKGTLLRTLGRFLE